MQFARYWISHTAVRSGRDGERQATAWGWSNVSESDAAIVAKKRSEEFAQILAAGGSIEQGYLQYSDRPLREPVLEEPAPGRVAVTRNLAGCEILNVAEIAFIDVDIHASASSGGFLAGLFGGKRSSPREKAIEEALTRLRDWVGSNPRQGFRVYETAGGLRYLLGSQPMEPDASSTQAMFSALQADPAYAQLCRVQKSFRARLTPKPWRCGMEKPPQRFPYPSAEANEKWRASYAACSSRFATCKFLMQIGSSSVHSSISEVVQLHDKRTRATEPLPLA